MTRSIRFVGAGLLLYTPLLAPLLLAAAVLLGGCHGEAAEPLPIRLVDRFAESRLTESPPPPEPPAATEWSFAGGEARGGSWQAGPRTADLRLTDEGLAGRSTGPYPAVVLTRTDPAGEGDRLHEIVIRARVSGGTSLSVTALGDAGPPSAALAGGESDLTLSLPLVPGPEATTYTIALDRTMRMGPLDRSTITRVLLRPTDAAGADFAIESVRLIFRKERFASIESGIGWHGLAEIWRDTLISRAPERISWQVDLPTEPWLDVALGTVSQGPVGFDVLVAEAGSEPVTVHAETLTTAERWHPRRIELDRWAGRRVELTLAARGSEDALAFWGSPVVRAGSVKPRTGAAIATGVRRPTGVVVVLADTLRRHHLNVYGHDRPNTPTLDRLAADGVLFLDAISQGTWTKVSVPSILSSLYPSTHEIVSFNDRLPSAAVTLAEAFQAAGFATWASSSVPFSGQLTNLHQGVEVLYERGALELPDGVSSSKTGRPFVDRLAPWLERHRDVPFFALVHAMDPHSPFRPYAPYDTLWTDEAAGRRYEREVDEVRPFIASPLLRRFGMPTREEMEAAGIDVERYLDHERAWYDASILALDAEIGRLVETLERLGRAEDTIIAFVSDHGEEFLEHGKHWHGLSVYAEMIEVPLMLHWPAGLPGGERVETTVQTLDLMPTLLELAGLPIPEIAQGTSLSPLWADDAPAGRRPPVVAERHAPGGSLGQDDGFRGSDSLALVDREWKLIWNVRPEAGKPDYELFHRPSDPMDQTNVADQNPETVARYAGVLERWRELAVAARLPSDGEAAQSLSADELERLRSLGYL